MLALPCCRRGSEGVSAPPTVTRGEQLPNIILLTVDTLRADHIALHGYGRNTMPSVEAFAKTARVFDNAVVPRGSTRPSYASMLTGLYPYRHGVRTNTTELHEDLLTLPEVLKSAGYHTAGFVSNSVLMADWSGFGQGFDVYDDRLEETESKRDALGLQYERTARNTLHAILAWLAADPPQPFFLFVNFIDPHGPYNPPAKYRKLYRTDKTRLLERRQMPRYQFIDGEYNYHDYVDRYDGEIHYAGEAVGILMDDLKSRGLWNDSFAIFTADHGECLGTHNIYFEHHYHVWEETMHVPLAIRLPDSSTPSEAVKPGRTDALVSPMDLPPTILGYLKIASDVDFDGRSLMPILAGGKPVDRALLLECLGVRIARGKKGDLYALRTATHKLMRILRQGTHRQVSQVIYHVAKDPTEKQSILFDAGNSQHRDLGGRLDAMLTRVHAYALPFSVTQYKMPPQNLPGVKSRAGHGDKVGYKRLTTQQAERLRSLGYVQ